MNVITANAAVSVTTVMAVGLCGNMRLFTQYIYHSECRFTVMIQPPPDWLARWAAVFGVFGTFFAYLFLAYLYKQQKDLLEIERMPSIDVSDYELHEDAISLVVSNYGHGLAKDFRIRTWIRYPDDREYRVTKRIYKLNPHGESTQDRSIGPQQNNVTFRAEPGFAFEQDQRYVNFSTGIYQAVNAGDCEFEYTVVLVYENQLDEKDTRPVFEGWRLIRLDNEEVNQIESVSTSLNFEEAFHRSFIIFDEQKDSDRTLNLGPFWR